MLGLSTGRGCERNRRDAAVERAFPTMKRCCGMSRVRYLGLARNARHLQFVAMAVNMKRTFALTGAT